MSAGKFAADTISDRLPDIRISTQPEDLICYSFDASGFESTPSAVVWPVNTEDVVKVIRYAYENGIPVVPRGAGTGMTAGAVPAKGAIILSFEKMNKILEIDSENLNVLCEPGLINGKLQRELERIGLFYPPDPASMNFCTIGGFKIRRYKGLCNGDRECTSERRDNNCRS
jgi:glycolate oxidase